MPLTEILLALSWGLSLAFVFSIGVTKGYQQAHREKMALIDSLKQGVFQLIERFKSHEKSSFVNDSYGGFGGRSRDDSQEAKEAGPSA